MVRSTIIVRASDALPLAASVDDEQVRGLTLPTPQPQDSTRDVSPRAFFIDRTDIAGAQAAGKAHLPADYTQCRT